MSLETAESSENVAEFAFIGPVDAGKSSLGGQLLAHGKWVCLRDLEKIFTGAEKDGMGRWKWARILDIFEEEAARGKTHEFTKIDFELDSGDGVPKKYRLVDTPGHGIFIRSMIEGVYGVETALVIVPMVDNEFEAALKSTLREHLIIARASGVEKIILVANKMDLVSWSEEEFKKKTTQVTTFLQRTGYTNVVAIPIDAYQGVGLFNREGLPSWYQGPTLLQLLGEIKPKKAESVEATRACPLFEGESFILDTRIVNYDSVITLGFTAIFHLEGGEYSAELVGIKNGDRKYLQNGDKCFTVWTLERPVSLRSDRVLIRKGDSTLGLGKIVKAVEVPKK